MQQIILGSAGFLLYFIYDINSVRKQNRLLQKFFAAGTILVVLSLFMELLIYTLFFALPFEQTYCEENRLRAAYTEGVYGLCRHPGVLWFAGAYLCMWGMFGGWKQGIYFLLMIFWNYLYIIFQDLWTFPQTVFNYREYQKNTPFLIPNKESIQACFYSVRKQ